MRIEDMTEMDHARASAAHDLYLEIASVINKHINLHGVHDPLLSKLLATALCVVAFEIEERIESKFRPRLASELIASWERDNGVEEG